MSEPPDSLVAAQTQLDALRLDREHLANEDQALAGAIATDEQQLAGARRERDALTAARRRRAALLYRNLADSVTLADAVLQSSMSPENENARTLELATSVDRNEQRRTRTVEGALHDLSSRLSREHRRRDALAKAMSDSDSRIAVLLDKLTAANAAISLVGPQAPAPPGRDPLAVAAYDAANALTTAESARQASAVAIYRAAATPTDAVLAEVASTAGATADMAQAVYSGKRATLARLVGRALRADGSPLDMLWVLTPSPALHAVLFALSQVGKPYVYATAGPDTYDCSGLTKRAWAESGIGLPHFSGAQLHAGLPLAVPALRPGDLLTYGPDGSVHVVLYIGNGWVVQAGGRSSGVVVTPADVDPMQGFAGASRPLP